MKTFIVLIIAIFAITDLRAAVRKSDSNQVGSERLVQMLGQDAISSNRVQSTRSSALRLNPKSKEIGAPVRRKGLIVNKKKSCCKGKKVVIKGGSCSKKGGCCSKTVKKVISTGCTRRTKGRK